MKSIIKYIGIIILFVTGSLPAFASELAVADSAYSAGDYPKAIELYKDIVSNKGVSAGLLYNLGNAYYKMGDDGKAMLYYERARKIDPSGKLINNNINFLSSKVYDLNKSEGGEKNMYPDQLTFLQSVYNLIAIDTTSNNWAVFAVISFLLLIGFGAVYLYSSKIVLKKAGFFGSAIFCLFTIIFIIFSIMSAAEYRKNDKAIIMTYKVALRSQPTEGAKESTVPLHKGTKVEILEDKTEKGNLWYKVRMNSENQGWIKYSDLEII